MRKAFSFKPYFQFSIFIWQVIAQLKAAWHFCFFFVLQHLTFDRFTIVVNCFSSSFKSLWLLFLRLILNNFLWNELLSVKFNNIERIFIFKDVSNVFLSKIMKKRNSFVHKRCQMFKTRKILFKLFSISLTWLFRLSTHLILWIGVSYGFFFSNYDTCKWMRETKI